MLHRVFECWVNSTDHQVELNIDEGDFTNNPPMKISINVSVASSSSADDLIESYKNFDHAAGDTNLATSIIDAIVAFELENPNRLKNMALIWDNDYPIMIQGDTAGYLRWNLLMNLVNSLIYAYLGDKTYPETTRESLEYKAAYLLRLCGTHNLGHEMFSPETYSEVIEEKDRIAPNWASIEEEAC